MIKMLVGRLRNKKGFTLIELIVVIAVLAILVLLALPRFIGQVDKAKLAQIKHDVKVAEAITAEHLITSGSLEDWGTELSSLPEGKAYNKRGVIGTLNPVKDGPYWKIPSKVREKINSKLNGSFYSNNNGDTYYIENSDSSNEELTDEEIDNYVNNLNYIPVATAQELQQINGSGFDEDNQPIFEELTWGSGTEWEREYTGTLDSDYIVVQDLDFSGYEDWTPIGKYYNQFTGNFNGANKVMKNLTINDDSGVKGLFGSAGPDNRDITFENIIIDNFNIYTSGNDVSPLIARFENVRNGSMKFKSISIRNVDITGDYNVGGLYGYGYSNREVTYEDINVNGEFTALSNIRQGSGYVGGLGGYKYPGGSSQSSSINNVEINLIINSNGDYAGGLFGYVSHPISTINNISGTYEINGSGYIGGLVGIMSATNQNVDNKNINLNGVVNASDESRYIGGLYGYYVNSIPRMNSDIDVNLKVNAKDGEYIGGLYGYISIYGVEGASSFQNIDVDGHIEGIRSVGGLIGYTYGDISKKFENVNVEADYIGLKSDETDSEVEGDAGGLIGSSFSKIDEIKDVEIKANIINKEGDAGGLVGYYSPSHSKDELVVIDEIKIDGKVQSIHEESSNTGGLIGYAGINNFELNEVNLTADILSNGNNVGGIFGFLRGNGERKLSNVEINSNINTPIGNVGGLFGTVEPAHNTPESEYINHKIIVSDIVISGLVGYESADNVGGLIGQSYIVPNITNNILLNSSVYGDSNVGVAIGNYNSTILDELPNLLFKGNIKR